MVLSDDGSGTSLADPGELALDKHGNLWVPNFDKNTVVEYAKDQLASSGNPAPAVKLTTGTLHEPLGAVFDSKGDLLVMNYTSGTIEKYSPKQLNASGAPIPQVFLKGTDLYSYQITFGPASYP